MAHPTLLGEQIDALNAVNLHISGIYHGRYASSPLLNREYCDAFEDDYNRVEDHVRRLDPGRGDTLAVEIMGLDPLVPIEFGFLKTARDKQEAAGILEDLRSTREISVIDYAAGMAQAKGVPCYPADIGRAEYGSFLSQVATIRHSRTLSEREKTRAEHELLLGRNPVMVQELGFIATRMVEQSQGQTSWDKETAPTLLFETGAMHVRGISRILRAHNIYFSSSNILGAIGQFAPQTSVKAYYRLHSRWERNGRALEAVLHQNQSAHALIPTN